MSSITTTPPAAPSYPAPLFSFPSLLAALFMVNLREKLDADTSGDKSDAAYKYGL
jgi:hypothetical protein